MIDVIPTDLLVGTSTDGRALVGQAHTACEGQLRGPVLIAASDAEALVKVFKPLVSSLGKETTHRSVLAFATGAGSVEVCEDPLQVPSGTTVTVPTIDPENYPQLEAALSPDPTMPVAGPDAEVIERSYGMGLSGEALEVFGKISKRRKMPIAWYAYHQLKPVVVEVGVAYRALCRPVPLDEDQGQHRGPLVRVFTAPLPTQPPRERERATLTGLGDSPDE